jgi:two-component system response regulator AtoC
MSIAGYQQSMPDRNNVLIAEDEPEVRNFLRLALRSENYDVDFVEDGEGVLNYLGSKRKQLSLLLLDILMPRRDGIETLQEVRKTHPDLPIIMMSGLTSPLTIVDAMKHGANDFLPKPISHEHLRRTIQKTLGLPAVVATPAPGINGQESFGSGDPWTKKLHTLLECISGSDVPVLMQGETGVGKEMLARQIHAGSARSSKPFLKLNCAALPAELVESELFGYDRGAFTGAFKNNPGKFELANGGTILLDEIGDMDVRLQAKLLQVLQDKEFIRLGSKESTRVDVRVIAATHCDLEKAITEGRFREDLYYRLNVVNIVIPPLRERKDEIIPLAEYFMSKHGSPGVKPPEILPLLKDALVNHDWPGNIRELENVIRKLLVVRTAATIADDLNRKARRFRNASIIYGSGPHMIDRRVSASEPKIHEQPKQIPLAAAIPVTEESTAAATSSRSTSILQQVNEDRRKAECQVILAALNRSLWNRKQAAALLEIDYKAFLYKMKKLGIGDKQRVKGIDSIPELEPTVREQARRRASRQHGA